MGIFVAASLGFYEAVMKGGQGGWGVDLVFAGAAVEDLLSSRMVLAMFLKDKSSGTTP